VKDLQTILVAEDDQAMRRLLVIILRSHGYRTMEAQNGLEAACVYGARAGEIALVITDIEMPVMDGLEALTRMRAVNPDVRAIVVSGRAEPFDQPIAAVHCWLSKPFLPQKLLESVERALDGRPEMR
jgi:two-component system cell cycle sensor histidine kinase/response regulator CckA